jgi:hypothetical protein
VIGAGDPLPVLAMKCWCFSSLKQSEMHGQRSVFWAMQERSRRATLCYLIWAPDLGVFLLVLRPNSFVHNQAHLKAVGSPLLGALLA